MCYWAVRYNGSNTAIFLSDTTIWHHNNSTMATCNLLYINTTTCTTVFSSKYYSQYMYWELGGNNRGMGDKTYSTPQPPLPNPANVAVIEESYGMCTISIIQDHLKSSLFSNDTGDVNYSPDHLPIMYQETMHICFHNICCMFYFLTNGLK